MADQFERTLDAGIAGLLDDGYETDRIYVSKTGNDNNGGSKFAPLLTITAALAAVTATRKFIIVEPGVYEEAAGLTWPTISGVTLAGRWPKWTTEISVASGVADQVINVAPGAVSSTFELKIMNLRINHDEAGLDGIKLNNTSMTKKLNCYLEAVGGDADSDSDKFLTVTHGDTSNAVRIYWSGPRNGEVDGAIYFAAGDGGDRLYINDTYLMGGIEFSTGAIALTMRLKDCVVKHEGVTGGSTSLVAIAMSCFSETGGTFAILDGNDIAGNITGELILGS